MPTVRSNGVDITYEERGQGEPLVLISGIGMQLVSWPQGFVDKLAARHRLVIFDNRDVGLSTKFEAAGVPPLRSLMARAFLRREVRAPYDLFDMARDVAGLLDALGLDRVHLAGASMGGMIAQAFAIEHGHRLKSLVSMMSYSGGRTFPGKPRAVFKLLKPPPRSRDEAAAFQLDFFRTAGSPAFPRDEVALADRARKAFDRCAHAPGFARQFAAVLSMGDLRTRLAAVRAPTLVLHGSADPIFRSFCAHDTARAIPGARLRMIEGWGHDLAEGAHDLLVDAITSHTSSHR